jgi:uncharacterized protein (TIGR02246 family)
MLLWENVMRKLRVSLFAAAMLVAGWAALIYAQQPAALPPTASTEEATLRATLTAYGTAYRQSDVEKVLAIWAPDAEYVDDEGTVTKGRDAIGKLFRQEFAGKKFESFHAIVTSLRFLRPDLAIVDGTASATVPDGTPDSGAFTSIWTKTNGQWLILSVRDLPDSAPESAPVPGAHLEPLDRLIGEWVSKDKDTVITINCRRSNKQSYLLVEQTVRVKGVEQLTLTQVIGWDPHREQIRSWVFDSAGGFGEGFWQRRGNEWFVDSTGVRVDGRTASSVNIWHFVDDNTLDWSSTDREIDGEALPDVRARYVRQAAAK